MGSYQRQRSRSTARIEPRIREWNKYKKERAGKRFEREREREMGKNVSVDDGLNINPFPNNNFRLLQTERVRRRQFQS